MKPMADYISEIGGFGFLETTWHHLRGLDWVKMYRFGSAAAWGAALSERAAYYGGTPQSDVMFDRALRMVGHDMKLTDYRDTGHSSYQVPPGWWIDN